MQKQSTAVMTPKAPKDDPFRKAARVVVEVNRKALEALKDK